MTNREKSSLLENLYRMTNSEVNALARNPYICESIQFRIARDHHLGARQWLALNPNLQQKAKDVLWLGKSATVKCNLVSAMHLNNEPQKIRELYFSKSVAYWSQNGWRLGNTFLKNYIGHRSGTFVNSPSDLLETIYDNVITKSPNGDVSWYQQSIERSLAVHPNVTTKLAIQLSHSSNNEIKRLAFDALVSLKQKISKNK